MLTNYFSTFSVLHMSDSIIQNPVLLIIEAEEIFASPEGLFMKLRLVCLAALFLTVFALDAVACGDSLYRVGKGVSYRVYTAPLPGSVLVYGQSEGAKQLAEALAQSGHGVRLVDNEMDLNIELESGNYDVVIAPYSEHSTVESSSEVSGSDTAYLPVAVNGDEEEIANQSYSKVMVADKDEIKHYLKAIHKTLKSKA